MKINKSKDKVYKLLVNNGHLRDSDLKLIACIWYSEVPNINDLTAYEFLQKFSNGELSNPESIRRSRQKLQEQIPALRGAKYKMRQAAQTEVRQQLNY
jgi:hypothetical protein